MESPILVTGCAGFIGAAVCRELLRLGEQVRGIDVLNDAYSPALKQMRLAELQAQPAFAWEQFDICDRGALERRFTRDRYRAVVHLAARAGVRRSVENPWAYVQDNVVGALNLLDACRTHGVPRLVLASTSSLYGDSLGGASSETADVSRPLSPYAATKLSAEALAHAYHHLHGLHATVLRYFTVYGPAGRPDMSVYRFVRQLVEDEPLVIYGTGEQSRDFTFVDDIARGTVAALRCAGYQVFNLGSDRPARVLDVVQLLAEHLQRTPRLEFRPASSADVRATWADIRRARDVLGWSPLVPLAEGLAQTADWYVARRDALRSIPLAD